VILQLLVFFLQETVLGIGQAASSGELGLPGHGATAPEAREPAGTPPGDPWRNLGRRMEIGWPANEDTPSLHTLLKSPWIFSGFNPRSMAYLQLYAFQF